MPQRIEYDVAWISKRQPSSNCELLRPVPKPTWTSPQLYESYDPPLYASLNANQYLAIPQLARGSLVRVMSKPTRKIQELR
uniref:Uncharacterized protein n=1 Tax=viral metagenome TaxID=1070528 RepID=A0A6C0BP69_9ZZZZ